jgi:hypothetical protein
MVPEYITRASIVGVCSSSCEEGFLVYRKKKKYCEWAVYLGEQIDKEMPELEFVVQGQGSSENQGTLPNPDESGRSNDEDEREEDDGRGGG